MHLICENYYLDSNILDTPTSPKERISHKELYSAYKSSKSHAHAERSSISIPVKESGSSPIMHSISPSAPPSSELEHQAESSRSRSWPKDQARSKSLAQAGKLQSKDLLDTEWVDFQGSIRTWSKDDSGPSLEEDEKLKSKELLDSEWIDFQHNIPDPPQAPKRKQSLLKGPDDEYDGSSTVSSRMASTSRAVSTSGIIQRRTSPTTNITGTRQMNIIQEDKEEVHFRKEK